MFLKIRGFEVEDGLNSRKDQATKTVLIRISTINTVFFDYKIDPFFQIDTSYGVFFALKEDFSEGLSQVEKILNNGKIPEKTIERQVDEVLCDKCSEKLYSSSDDLWACIMR